MKALFIGGLAGVAAALGGCAGHVGRSPQPLTIDFALQAAGQPVRCAQPLGPLGKDSRPALLHDARLYVQDVALIDAAGESVPVALARNDWQNGRVALLDFEDASGACRGGTPATNRVLTGTVPARRYTGLTFTVGVPEALNHTSTELEEAPLDIAALGWSWQAGRKFAKLEVDPVGGVDKADGSTSATWYVHLGATGCTGNPVSGETVGCLRGNRIPVRFEAFDARRQQVVLDLAELLRGSELGRDRGAAVGCMSGPTDPECRAVFERLGLDPHSGLPVAAGRSAVFVVRDKP